MNESQYTLEQAHLELAKRTNGEVWELLGKDDRSAADDEQMVLAAFASLYHWRHVGTEVNDQRGLWMIAHVFTVLGRSGLALEYAELCLALTEAHRDQMADFDVAYAYEGVARARALAGDTDEAQRYLAMARAAGDAIANPEDKKIFVGDLGSGDWYGVG
jgi:hypothetical protein